jgi:hypothetical protein
VRLPALEHEDVGDSLSVAKRDLAVRVREPEATSEGERDPLLDCESSVRADPRLNVGLGKVERLRLSRRDNGEGERRRERGD